MTRAQRRALADEWSAWMRHLYANVERQGATREEVAYYVHTSLAHFMGQVLLGILGVDDADPSAQVHVGDDGVLGYFEGIPVIASPTARPHKLALHRRGHVEPDPPWLLGRAKA